MHASFVRVVEGPQVVFHGGVRCFVPREVLFGGVPLKWLVNDREEMVSVLPGQDVLVDRLVGELGFRRVPGVFGFPVLVDVGVREGELLRTGRFVSDSGVLVF